MTREDHELLQIAATGETITILQSTGMTGGAFFRFEDRITGKTPGPPPHRHLKQSETFTVKQGTVNLKVGKEWHPLQVGDTYTVPAGVSHTFTSTGMEDLVMEVVFTPALDTERFFRSMAQASSEGKAALLQIAVLNQVLESRFYLGGVPQSLQNVLFALLAVPARWLGYVVWSPQVRTCTGETHEQQDNPCHRRN